MGRESKNLNRRARAEEINEMDTAVRDRDKDKRTVRTRAGRLIERPRGSGRNYNKRIQ